jgi:ribosomal protein S6--L-glutamate ligase
MADKPEKKTIRKLKLKPQIGWQEFCSLPDLGLPIVKAKIDSGAKTSALHAFDIKVINQGGEKFVRFNVQPLQRKKLALECIAPLVEKRYVISSNGEREKRYVILTTIVLGERTFEAELTLTSRHNMAFRMLIGREALRKAKVVIDPSKSFLMGKKEESLGVYRNIEQKDRS